MYDRDKQRAGAFRGWTNDQLGEIHDFLDKCYEITTAREIKEDIKLEIGYRKANMTENKLTSEPASSAPAIPDFSNYATGRIKVTKEILDVFGPEFPVGKVAEMLGDELNKRENYQDLSSDVNAFRYEAKGRNLNHDTAEALAIFLSKRGYKK